ncbi:MAG: winged helix DNA-binding protein [Caulobacterales bacterium]
MAKTKKSNLHYALSRELLDFFYPVHYRLGMDLETVMCQGRISRKQAAILWLTYSQAQAGGWVRRKEIELSIATWFEISNSNISKLLRELSKPPLSLVEQVENPDSGREKVVRLTKAGQIFVDGMVEASVNYLAKQLSHVSAEEFRWGVDFAALAFGGAVPADGATETPRLRPPSKSVIGAAQRQGKR